MYYKVDIYELGTNILRLSSIETFKSIEIPRTNCARKDKSGRGADSVVRQSHIYDSTTISMVIWFTICD